MICPQITSIDASRPCVNSPLPPGSSELALTTENVAKVADLYGRCADYFLLQDGEAPTLADAQELFTDVPIGKTSDEQTVLGWQGMDGLSAVAAILRDYPLAGTWYLGLLLVEPAHRCEGLGRSIYAEIEAWALAEGAREMRLAVLEANERGAHFWRSCGFHALRRVGPDQFKTRSHWRIEYCRHLICWTSCSSPVSAGQQ